MAAKPGGPAIATYGTTVGGSRSFPIVGIGASAGGLEALEAFLKNVPAGCGMAFVIIQHLDPTHRGIMPELLQRDTGMKVVQVRDRTVVKPECVYVIPPNKDMSLLHGVLHLMAPAAPRGLRLPIDFFFRSLALDRADQGIGVILSGMGSDGTLGLRAIKEQAGLVLVQEPTSAKFDGMPRSAIDAGLADIVAPVEELPGRIMAYLQHAPATLLKEVGPEDRTQGVVEKVVILLRSHTGHDFSQYKRNTLHRRIERRMGIHQITRLPMYVRYLQENSQELDLLFKELLIGVTNFFRDPIVWEKLATEVLPSLLAERTPGSTLRAWIPGCSTGEEAYSLAMVFQEAAERIKPKGNFTLQIFATDLDPDAIERARQGLFPANIAADVSAERLERFFVQEDRGYRVRKAIRERIIFAPQDLMGANGVRSVRLTFDPRAASRSHASPRGPAPASRASGSLAPPPSKVSRRDRKQPVPAPVPASPDQVSPSKAKDSPRGLHPHRGSAPVRPAHDVLPRPGPVDPQWDCHPTTPSPSPSNCQLDRSDPIALPHCLAPLPFPPNARPSNRVRPHGGSGGQSVVCVSEGGNCASGTRLDS